MYVYNDSNLRFLYYNFINKGQKIKKVFKYLLKDFFIGNPISNRTYCIIDRYYKTFTLTAFNPFLPFSVLN